jgi:hypothetical protein
MGSSSSNQEKARTSRGECWKTMSRHASTLRYQALITKDRKENKEEKGIDRTLSFDRESSVQNQSHFERPLKSRLKRDSSITTCVKGLLCTPSMTHRTYSMKMIEDSRNSRSKLTQRITSHLCSILRPLRKYRIFRNSRSNVSNSTSWVFQSSLVTLSFLGL